MSLCEDSASAPATKTAVGVGPPTFKGELER